MKNNHEGHRIYQCLPHITWAVDCNRVILINEHIGRMRILQYPQAAVWDLLSQGFQPQPMGCILSEILAIDPDEAKTLLVSTLENLLTDGFLTEKHSHG